MQKNVQILTMAKNKWITGIEWERLAGDDFKASIKSAAEKNSCDFGLLIEYNDTTAIGLAPKNFKGVSASESLAYANQIELNKNDVTNYNPDWIVIEDLGDDKFWMGVTKKGLPAPGYDVILNITEVKDNIIELLYSDTYQIFSTSSEVQAIFSSIKHIENKSLSDLTTETRSKATFKKYLGIPPAAIYAGIAAILLLGGSYFAWEHLEGQKLVQEALRAQQQAEQLKAQKQLAYQQKLKDFEVQKVALENAAKNRVINGLSGSPSDMLNAWYSAVGNMEIGTHGWTLMKVSCYYDAIAQPKNFACDYLFKRNGLTTNRMLIEDYPDAILDGDNAVISRKVPIAPENLKTPDISVINSLKDAKNWNAEMVSQLQLLKLVNINYQFNESNEITFEVPALPLSPEEEEKGVSVRLPTQQSLGVAQGTLNVSGRDFDFVKEFADNVNFYGTGLRKVDFTVGQQGSISWDATFDFFISTKTGKLSSGNSNAVSIGNNNGNIVPSGNNNNQLQIPASRPVMSR